MTATAPARSPSSADRAGERERRGPGRARGPDRAGKIHGEPVGCEGHQYAEPNRFLHVLLLSCPGLGLATGVFTLWWAPVPIPRRSWPRAVTDAGGWMSSFPC